MHIWVSHVLTEGNLFRRINDCDTLIRRQRKDPFLKRIVTGNNAKRKMSSKKNEQALTYPYYPPAYDE